MAQIGIIVPIYNMEGYVKKCIESILAQNFEEFELILVDDGSTDKSGTICDEYARQDERIRVIHKENGGPAEARNAGLEENQSEYIVFIDADDYVDSRYLDMLYQCIRKSNADLAMCCTTIIMSDCIREPVFMYDEILSRIEVLSKAETYKRMMLPGETAASVCAWGKIYHTKLFRTVRYPVGEFYEDCRIIDRIIEACQKIVYIPYAGYFYLVRPGSITHGKMTLKHLAAVKNAGHLLHLMEEKYPEVKSIARGYYARECLLVYESMSSDPKYKRECHWLRREIIAGWKELVRYSCFSFEMKCSAICICMGPVFYKAVRNIWSRLCRTEGALQERK